MADERRLRTRWADGELEDIYGMAVRAGKLLIDSARGTAPIGLGDEKIVYDYSDGKVVVFLPPNERPDYINRLKHFYYFNKLAHILMPQNIPDAHMVGSSPPMMVLDKVENSRLATHEEIIELQDKAARLGLWLDSNMVNYLVSENGTTYFVDALQLDDENDGETKLKKAVEDLPEPKRKVARRYYSRLDSNESGKHISDQKRPSLPY